MTPKPLVSVVVPALNSPQRTAICLEALLQQDYPRDCYEVIVVDNGSTDQTPDVIKRYPVMFLQAIEVRSPYLARNVGIDKARGSIIALIDVNCTASSTWISTGVRALEETQSDLVGGQVAFTFSGSISAAEFFDSISNVNMKQSIEQRGVAKGGNLFIRRSVFASIGMFPSTLRSGGDVLWTGKATKAGHKLTYSHEAVVHYPARPLLPLLKKQFRVGRGQPTIYRNAGSSTAYLFKQVILGLRPPSRARLKHHIEAAPISPSLLSVWLVGWACNIVTSAGRLCGIMTSRSFK